MDWFLIQDLDTGEVLTQQYVSVINACGHHWDPLWPELKGDFKGSLSHAHAYRSPKPFQGKRVCIIGGGNSGILTLGTSMARLNKSLNRKLELALVLLTCLGVLCSAMLSA